MTKQLEYVYEIRDGKLFRHRVIHVDGDRFEAVNSETLKPFQARFTSSWYHATEQEAVATEHREALETLQEMRKDLQEALAEFKDFRKVHGVDLETYSARLERDY